MDLSSTRFEFESKLKFGFLRDAKLPLNLEIETQRKVELGLGSKNGAKLKLNYSFLLQSNYFQRSTPFSFFAVKLFSMPIIAWLH
jgi:hypothetical protein